MLQKVGATKHIMSPLLRKVGGTCPPVHPMIDAHAGSRWMYWLTAVVCGYRLLHDALLTYCSYLGRRKELFVSSLCSVCEIKLYLKSYEWIVVTCFGGMGRGVPQVTITCYILVAMLIQQEMTALSVAQRTISYIWW